MIKKLFTEHPKSVDETYLEHALAALSFAFYFGYAFIAAIIHAFLPFLFVKTGSQIVTILHNRMVTNRHKLSQKQLKPTEKQLTEYELEYVI